MKKKRLLSLVMALAMIFGFTVWVPDLEAFAASYNGNIYNNGLGGIYIDISAYPYNSMNNGTSYASNGCAWFASCRAKQFSDKVNKIWGANNWVNYGSSYGFTVDNTPSAGSIMCWTTGNGGNGHVAFLEKIEGNTAYISEGGCTDYPNNSYCHIYTVSVSSMTSKKDSSRNYMKFGGYVHVGSSGTKPAWAKVTVPKSTFAVGEDITFTLTSDSGKAYTVGIDDASGNRIHTYGSPIRSDTTTQVYTYRISKPGNYSCYITAHNDIGLCDSDRIYFSVATKPSWAKVSIPKFTFTIGEDITFTLTSDSGKAYTVGIDDASGNRIHTYGSPIRSDTTTQVYTYRISKPGNYSCYITAHNDIGLCDSERIYFKIAQPVDLGDHFYANITNNDLQKMTCNGNVTFDSAYKEKDQIWYFIKQNDGSYMIQSLSSGAYNGWYLEVANGGTDPGTNISTMYEWLDDNPAQKWYIYGEQNAYILKPKCADLVVTSADNSLTGVSNAQLEKYTGNSNQLLEINKLCDKNEGIHSYNEWVVNKKATCEENGQKQHKCIWCGDIEKDIINKLGHNYVETVVAPTCTIKGYTNHKCTRCKDEYNDTETQMTSHSFGDWRTTTAPTCTEKGAETRICSVCKASESQEIKALGHDYVASIVPPTCTSKGYTLYKCSRCNDEFKDNYTEPTGNHKWSEWKTTAFDINKRTSTQTRTCSTCNKTESRTTENAIQRLAGAGRYATAVEISKAGFPDGSDTVVLAYGLNYADALAGVSLAKAMNAPILLTNLKTLPAETLAEIKRLKAKNVIILGGTGAVGKEVEAALNKEGLKTERIAGATRFETATKIAEKMQKLNDKAPEEVYFVYAFNSADALSVSPIAASKNAPIIYLSTKGDLNADTAAYLAKLKKAGCVKNAYVIGGEGVISNDMATKAAKALGLSKATRIAGANRFATCVAVNEKFADVLNGDMLCVATGMDFPDALAGGVYAAINKAPLFLINGKLKTPQLSDEQKAYLKTKAAGKITAFGGTGVVPDNHIADIAKISI